MAIRNLTANTMFSKTDGKGNELIATNNKKLAGFLMVAETHPEPEPSFNSFIYNHLNKKASLRAGLLSVSSVSY